MKPENQRKIRKCFFIKSYRHIWHVEEAIKTIRTDSGNRVQMSVLGKLAQDYFSNDREIIKAKKELKRYWKDSLGPTSDFGLFCNPEIGTLFIVGALVSQFLHDMDGKALGEITAGPYGILRGLGISKNEVSDHLKALDDAHNLLILRGYYAELKRMNEILKGLE